MYMSGFEEDWFTNGTTKLGLNLIKTSQNAVASRRPPKSILNELDDKDVKEDA
jgi:hypothetical protein